MLLRYKEGRQHGEMIGRANYELPSAPSPKTETAAHERDGGSGNKEKFFENTNASGLTIYDSLGFAG
jgi:hypothetical protein